MKKYLVLIALCLVPVLAAVATYRRTKSDLQIHNGTFTYDGKKYVVIEMRAYVPGSKEVTFVSNVDGSWYVKESRIEPWPVPRHAVHYEKEH